MSITQGSRMRLVRGHQKTLPGETNEITHKCVNPAALQSRRAVLATCLSITPLIVVPQQVLAADAPPPPIATAEGEPACAACVGYVDGTLAACSTADEPCSSSYDDRPAHFVAPWEYDGSTQAAMNRLEAVLTDFGASIQQTTDDYIYAVLNQESDSALDLEFVFAPNDNTVTLRAAQRVPAASSSSSSSSQDPAQAAISLPISAVSSLLSQIGLKPSQPSQVLEDLRLQLGWEVVPILRNRQRLFLFGESPFDSFGPVPPPVPDYNKDLRP